MSSAIIITDKNFKKEVQRCKTPVLLSFTAGGGVSSFLLRQNIDGLSGELDGKIKIGVVSTTNADNITYKFNIKLFPTTVIIKNGTVTDRIVGNMNKNGLLNVLFSDTGS